MVEVTKEDIRKRILSIRTSLGEQAIEERSTNICNQILKLDSYKDAEIVLGYIPTRGEVNIIPILEDARGKGKKVYVPKVLGKRRMEFFLYVGIDSLKKGRFGILEPEEIDKFDYECNNQGNGLSNEVLMLIPGVAFDKNNNRLGYGGGFYDTYLEDKDIYTIAPVYDFQLVEKVPVEKNDKKVCIIIKSVGDKKI